METNTNSTHMLVLVERVNQLLAIEQAAREVVKRRTSFGWCKACGGVNPNHMKECVVGKLQDALGEDKTDG